MAKKTRLLCFGDFTSAYGAFMRSHQAAVWVTLLAPLWSSQGEYELVYVNIGTEVLTSHEKDSFMIEEF